MWYYWFLYGFIEGCWAVLSGFLVGTWECRLLRHVALVAIVSQAWAVHYKVSIVRIQQNSWACKKADPFPQTVQPIS